MGDDVANKVLAISDSNNSLLATVPVVAPWVMAYDSGKGEIFVTDLVDMALPEQYSNAVTVISDSLPLVAPSVYPSNTSVIQGQTSILEPTLLTTGASPYLYQWFSEAPNASTYSLIGDGISPNYNFTTTTSTPTGNWAFMLQVTDATGAAVNSTAATVTVNAPAPTPTVQVFSPAVIILIIVVIAAVTLCAVALAYKKLTRTNSVSKQTTK